MLSKAAKREVRSPLPVCEFFCNGWRVPGECAAPVQASAVLELPDHDDRSESSFFCDPRYPWLIDALPDWREGLRQDPRSGELVSGFFAGIFGGVLFDLLDDDLVLVWPHVLPEEVGDFVKQREQDLVHALAAARQSDHRDAVKEERAAVDPGTGKRFHVDEPDADFSEEIREIAELARNCEHAGE